MAKPIRDHRRSFEPWQAAVFLVAVTGLSALATPRDGRTYWRGLKKSPRVPPAWVFPAVWTGLNVLQVWADLRILNDKTSPDRGTLLALRALNWGLYALFTPAFFRAKSPVAGEIVTLAEGVTAGATLAILARRDPTAALALAPLTAWTAYAALIGGDIARANPDSLVQRLRWGGAF